MGDARTGTGNLAWVTWGLAALSAHLLLLWSVPSPPVETELAAATTVAWEIETWEAPAPSAPVSDTTADPAAIAAPMQAQAVQAPRTRKASQRKARAAANAPGSDEAGAADTHGAALEPRVEDATGETRSADAPRGDEAQGAAALQRRGDDGILAAAGPTTDQGDATGTRQQLAAGSGRSSGAGTNGQGAGALLRGPRLLAAHDPCAGFFPGTAQAKRGQVQLSIDVDAQGHPHPTQTLLELPLGQGFESAAKACAAHLHFAPALDAQGHPVSARARIALRFERS